MRNQCVILLLALLGTTSAQAADTDRKLARQLALQQKQLLPSLLKKASQRLKRQAMEPTRPPSIGKG